MLVEPGAGPRWRWPGGVGLRAGGEEYSFAISLKGVDSDRDCDFSFSGRSFTVVLESWTAGN
jgi:hypothetical protein